MGGYQTPKKDNGNGDNFEVEKTFTGLPAHY